MQLKEVTDQSEQRIQELTEQLQRQQIEQLSTVKEVSRQVKEQEIQQLKNQFAKVSLPNMYK